MGLFGFPEPQMNEGTFRDTVIETWDAAYQVKLKRIRGQQHGGWYACEWTSQRVYDQHLTD
jgi:hypothetical protein